MADEAEPPAAEQAPPRRVSNRVLLAALGGFVVLLAVMAWVVTHASSWRSGIVVESYRATDDGSKWELCANGHFDLGFLGELLSKFGMEPTDNGATDCVNLLFDGPPAAGTYRIAGEGQRGTLLREGSTTFKPRAEHAPALKSVWLDRGCFCSNSASEVSFDGTLTLTAVAPPRGRLSLEVGADATHPPAHIDIALSSFEWERQGMY